MSVALFDFTFTGSPGARSPDTAVARNATAKLTMKFMMTTKMKLTPTMEASAGLGEMLWEDNMRARSQSHR